MTRSLWIKLMGAFALVIVVGTGMVVFLVSRATTGQFELYVTQSGRQWAAWLAPALAGYYARSGSWSGVETVLQNPWAAGGTGGEGWMGDMMGDGMDMMEGMGGWWNEPGMMSDNMWAASGNRLILTDAEALVVADTAGALVGTRLPADDVARGMPITVEQRRVGTLIVTPFDAPATPAGDFLGAVNRSVLWAGLAAGGVALVMGSILFFQIIRPLRSLSAAARGITQGDLSRRAWVGDKDEVGQVALTFNQMAETLQGYAVERRNMIADIAHELRTPLSVMQSNLEAMLDGVLPASSEELASLHQEALLLNRLIGDLRTLSLAEARQLRLEKRPVDVGALVQQVTDRLRLRAGEKGITLATEVAPGLPEIQADPERLAQALGNLVDNALRYTRAGTCVAVEARPAPGGVELAVRDEGPGLLAEDLPHVFNRFWRAEKSRNRATGGSGLGLAIVRQLAEAHGGQAMVESPTAHPTGPARGARFSLRLPAGRSA